MSDKLKIKLSVANRIYPLTIDPSQEEGLRLASQQINSLIKKFEQNYSVRDKQDALAMCALQIASSKKQNSLNEENKWSELKFFKSDYIASKDVNAWLGLFKVS